MPQITVTLDEMTYMDLVHYLPKGLKSAFVNEAVGQAILICTDFWTDEIVGNAMHSYARKGQDAAKEKVKFERSLRQKRQKSLRDFDEKFGGEEE